MAFRIRGNAAGSEYLQTTDYAGGYNFYNYFGSGQPQYFFKTYYDNLTLATTNYTSGQQEAIENVVNCHGTGDCLAMTTLLTCDGGMNTSDDEGCHGGDFAGNRGSRVSIKASVTVGGAAVGATVVSTVGTAGPRDQRDKIDCFWIRILQILYLGTPLLHMLALCYTGPSNNSAINPDSASDSNATFPISTMVQLCYAGTDNGVGGSAGCAAGSQPTGFIPSAPNMINPAASVVTNVVASYSPTSSPQTGLPSGFCTPSTLQSTTSRSRVLSANLGNRLYCGPRRI